MESLTTSPEWCNDVSGLPWVSNFIWSLAPQQGVTSCCTVNISMFLSTLSSSYPSLCGSVSSIQVLGSWGGSPGRFSPSTGKGIGEGFVLYAPFPYPSIYFHVSIHLSIRESSRWLQRNSEPYQTWGHGKGFYLESVEYCRIKRGVRMRVSSSDMGPGIKNSLYTTRPHLLFSK